MRGKNVTTVTVRSTPDVDRESDLIGLVDIIELQLGLSCGEGSLRNRLADVAAALRSTGNASESHVQVLLDAVDRLEMIERLLRDAGL